MNYEQAKEMLSTARSESAGKPYANNTRLYRRGEDITMRLHATDIVTFHPNGHITLDSGGWRTVTTMERMRHVANVLQVKGQWYIGGQSDELRPEWAHRELPKPYEAIDPGPEPVKSKLGCKAGEWRTVWVATKTLTRRIDMDPRDRWEPALSSDEWVNVLGWEQKTTIWGESAYRYTQSTAKYQQCPHCARFDKLHSNWSEFMNGDAYGRAPKRGYRQMVEYLERFGSREAWMAAFKEEGREVRAEQKAYHEWEQRDRIEFFDGIRLNSNGRVVNPPRKSQRTKYQRAVDKQKREIADFIKLARKTLVDGMPMPGPGDCWYCCMTAHDGKPLGDAVDTLHADGSMTVEANNEHLRSHIEEGYVVPSLITNAMLEAGYKPVGVYMLLDMNPDEQRMGGKNSDWSNSYDRGPYASAMRALRKYLTKRLVPTNPKEVANAR